MSNIPRARDTLLVALDCNDIDECKHWVRKALKLMTRQSPAFRVQHDVEPLTDHRRRRARNLRRKGLSMRAIALALNTNIGRVSEAINGQPH